MEILSQHYDDSVTRSVKLLKAPALTKPETDIAKFALTSYSTLFEVGVDVETGNFIGFFFSSLFVCLLAQICRGFFCWLFVNLPFYNSPSQREKKRSSEETPSVTFVAPTALFSGSVAFSSLWATE